MELIQLHLLAQAPGTVFKCSPSFLRFIWPGMRLGTQISEKCAEGRERKRRVGGMNRREAEQGYTSKAER